MQPIDKADKNILFMLTLDAKQSVKKIAKQLRMKQDTVAYRIKQLEKAGIITDYFTIIDYSKLGYSLVRLYLKLQSTTPDIENEILQSFISEKSIFTVYKTEGEWDIAVGFLIRDLETFDDWYKKFLTQYKQYIFMDRKALFLEYIQYPRNYLVKKEFYSHELTSIGKAKPVVTDEIDLQLLCLLAKNAKLSLLALAQKLKMTSMAIRYRLKILEKKKIILGYSALLDISQLGYHYYKVDLDLNDINKYSLLFHFLSSHPNVIYLDKTFGGSDLEFDGEFPSQEAFYDFITELKEKFPGVIRTHHYYRAQHIYKYEYFPEL